MLSRAVSPPIRVIAGVSFLFAVLPSAAAAGDCDQNGIDDAMEIAAGTASDCDQNGFPDACDLALSFGATSTSRIRLPGPPVAVVARDFDGDGRIDLATITQSTPTLSILRGRGDGSFEPPLVIALEMGPSHFAVADLEGDGDTDFVVESSEGGVVVLENQGDARFEIAPLPAPAGTNDLAAGDLDGDGRAEIVVHYFRENRISIYRQDGEAWRADPDILTPGPSAVELRDVDGDEDLEIIALSGRFPAEELRIFGDAGDGTFSQIRNIPLDEAAFRLVSGDFDGDRDLDLFAVTRRGFDVLANDGGGGFARVASHAVIQGIQQIHPSEIAADGVLDLLVTTGNAVAVLRGRGDGHFTESVSFADSNGVRAAVAADFDGDGDPDCATISTASFPHLAVVLNEPRAPIADCDQDGVPDACAIRTGSASDCNHNGIPDDCELADSTRSDCDQDGIPDDCEIDCNSNCIADGEEIVSGAAADCDEDGEIDSCQLAAYLRRNPGESVGAPRQYFLETFETADLDGDGDEELVLALGDSLRAYDDRDGEAIDEIWRIDARSDSLHLADLDQDGRLEVVYRDAETGELLLQQNPGSRALPGASVIAQEVDRGSLASADLDDDGHVDLVLAQRYAPQVLTILADGRGGFSPPIPGPSLANPFQVHLHDLDQDGDEDLVTLAVAVGELVVALNDGTGRFEDAIGYEAGRTAFDLFLADLDEDGSLDAVVTNPDPGEVSILWGDGPRFETRESFPVVAEPLANVESGGFFEQRPEQVTGGDVDGDGRVDLLVGNSGSAFVNVFVHRGGRGFAELEPIRMGVWLVDIQLARFGPDGTLDLLAFLAGDSESRVLAMASESSRSTLDCDQNGTLDACEPPDRDCNQNGVPDSCEIVRRLALDCDGNGVPDECDIFVRQGDCDLDGRLDICQLAEMPHLDCDRNGVLDTCDIARGRSADCDIDRIPDECELEAGTLADCDLDGVPDACALEPRLGVRGAASIPVPSDPRSTCAADLDGDGTLDVLLASALARAVTVLWGAVREDESAESNGAWTPAGRTTVQVPGEALDVACADLDQDGDLDLAAAYASAQASGVAIIRNRGERNLSLETFARQGRIARLSLLDLDADGRAEIIALNSLRDRIEILRNGPKGLIELALELATGRFPVDLLAADLDGDGHLDLATANLGSRDVAWLLGDGAGGFGPVQRTTTGDGTYALAALDARGVGPRALAVALRDEPRLRILEIGPGGAIERASDLAAPIGVTALRAGDIDGDGAQDLVATVSRSVPGAQSIDALAIWLASPEGFEVARLVPAGRGASSIALADLDRDARLDAVVAHRFGDSLTVHSERDALSDLWFAARMLAPGEVARAILEVASAEGASADEDSLTFLADDGASLVSVSIATGLEIGREALPRAGYSSAHAAPLDEAPGLERILLHPGGALSVLPGDPQTGMAPMEIEVGGEPADLTVADLDRNGSLDFAVACRASSRLLVYLRDASGLTEEPMEFATDGDAAFVEAVDLDGDGWVDLVAGVYSSGGIAIFWNDAGSFAERTQLRAGGGPSALIANDIDLDGHADLIAASSLSDSVWIWHGRGGHEFAEPVVLRAGKGPSALAAIDLDGDRDADLAIPCRFSHEVFVFQNRGPRAWEPALGVLAGNEPVALRMRDIDGDERPDFLVANAAGDRRLGALTVLTNASRDSKTADADRDGIPDRCEEASFLRGDVDADGRRALDDAVQILEHLFRGGPAPPCAKAADSDDDGRLGITDAIALLIHLFAGVEALPAPFATCGLDPVEDGLDCTHHAACH